MNKQAKLLIAIQEKGFNIVTCGHCGDIFIHKTEEEELFCPHCEKEFEPCDCPDLFYEVEE